MLDVGCGTGYLSRILAAVAGPEGHVTGVDPSPKMITHARLRAPANCTYLVGVAQSLELADGAFDLVVSTLALHHVPEEARAAAVAEMFRVLRPGGRLLIAEYRPPANPLLARIAGLFTGPAVRHRHAPHARRARPAGRVPGGGDRRAAGGAPLPAGRPPRRLTGHAAHPAPGRGAGFGAGCGAGRRRGQKA